jgi:hypothetical protein
VDARRRDRRGHVRAKAAPQPLHVNVGRFSSIRRRLDEAGIRYTITSSETPPPGAQRLPTPGPSFWFAGP